MADDDALMWGMIMMYDTKLLGLLNCYGMSVSQMITDTCMSRLSFFFTMHWNRIWLVTLATRRVPLLKHDLHTISDHLSFFRFIVVFIFPNVFCVHGVLCHCLSLCKDCEMQNTNKSAVPLHLSTMLNNLSCSYLFLLTYRTVNKLSRVNLYSCSYAWKQ